MGNITDSSTALPSTFVRPPLNPRDPNSPFRNVLDLISHNAAHNPNHIFAIQLQKNPGSDGTIETVTVTHRQLQRAVISCAISFQQNAPERDSCDPAPVALLMESDITLLVYVFALMNLHIPVLLLSARLNSVAINHLLISTGAASIVASAGSRRKAEDSLAISHESGKEVRLQEQQSFEFFVANSDDAGDEALGGVAKSGQTALIYHSSGTTGMPKPIYHTERYFLAFATCHKIPSAPSGPCFSTLPLFHAFGWVPPCLSLSIGMPVCFPPKSTIPNANAMSSHLRLTGATSLVSVPSILEDFAIYPKLAEEALGKLSFVAFGGGRLKDSAGQILSSRRVRLLNHFGATESGPLAPLFEPNETYDWRYFRLREDADIELRSTGLDNEGQETFQLIIRPLGWNGDYQLQDHLIRRPGSLHLDYNAVGRKDDVLVLANGEKVQPGVLEAQVIEEPGVQAVVAFGNDQAEIGVLLQPTRHISVEERDSFVDLVWPTIEKANLLMDAHSQVTSRHCVLVVPHSAVLPRTDKGSIMRREVYAMFAEEIQDVYNSLERSSSQEAVEPLRKDWLEEDISKLVNKHIRLRAEKHHAYGDDDLFELGLDSLQALQLRRRLQASMERSDEPEWQGQQLPRDFVYRFPSVRKMAQGIRGDAVEASDFYQLVDRFQPHSLAKDTKVPRGSHAAVVTGATGGLGSHIVAELVKKASVGSVVCLVRPLPGKDSKSRVLQALSKTAINVSQAEIDKLCVLECHISQHNLGLSQEGYNSLLIRARWIVHAAWPMNFKLGLASFEPTFQTLQNLLTLTKRIDGTNGRKGTARFVFISSIATVGRWAEVTGEAIIPEQRMKGPECAVNIGYAQAKLVCEAIIDQASGQTKVEPADMAVSLSAQYIRIGQLVGSSLTGMWNEDEHFPALVKSSQAIGALPQLTGTLSWIPVDIAAQAVCDIVLCEAEDRQTVFHVENPVRQSWADMLSSIASALSSPANRTALPALPYQEWLQRLRQQEDVDTCPAVKLLPFFADHFERMACGSVTLDTFAARRASPALRRLRGVGEADVNKYIGRWRESGFLS